MLNGNSERHDGIEKHNQNEDTIKNILNKLKSVGLIDNFRKDFLENGEKMDEFLRLRSRVENTIKSYLNGLKWIPEMNRNVERNLMRRRILESSYYKREVENIMSKAFSNAQEIFLPAIEDAVHSFLGIENAKHENSSDQKPNVINTNEAIEEEKEDDVESGDEEEESQSLSSMDIDSSAEESDSGDEIMMDKNKSRMAENFFNNRIEIPTTRFIPHLSLMRATTSVPYSDSKLPLIRNQDDSSSGENEIDSSDEEIKHESESESSSPQPLPPGEESLDESNDKFHGIPYPVKENVAEDEFVDVGENEVNPIAGEEEYYEEIPFPPSTSASPENTVEEEIPLPLSPYVLPQEHIKNQLPPEEIPLPNEMKEVDSDESENSPQPPPPGEEDTFGIPMSNDSPVRLDRIPLPPSYATNLPELPISKESQDDPIHSSLTSTSEPHSSPLEGSLSCSKDTELSVLKEGHGKSNSSIENIVCDDIELDEEIPLPPSSPLKAELQEESKHHEPLSPPHEGPYVIPSVIHDTKIESEEDEELESPAYETFGETSPPRIDKSELQQALLQNFNIQETSIQTEIIPSKSVEEKEIRTKEGRKAEKKKKKKHKDSSSSKDATSRESKPHSKHSKHHRHHHHKKKKTRTSSTSEAPMKYDTRKSIESNVSTEKSSDQNDDPSPPELKRFRSDLVQQSQDVVSPVHNTVENIDEPFSPNSAPNNNMEEDRLPIPEEEILPAEPEVIEEDVGHQLENSSCIMIDSELLPPLLFLEKIPSLKDKMRYYSKYLDPLLMDEDVSSSGEENF